MNNRPARRRKVRQPRADAAPPTAGAAELARAGFAPAAMLRLAGAAGLLAVLAPSQLPAAGAEQRVLGFHHFLPEKSPQHRDIYLPWAKRIADASKGRLR